MHMCVCVCCMYVCQRRAIIIVILQQVRVVQKINSHWRSDDGQLDNLHRSHIKIRIRKIRIQLLRKKKTKTVGGCENLLTCYVWNLSSSKKKIGGKRLRLMQAASIKTHHFKWAATFFKITRHRPDVLPQLANRCHTQTTLPHKQRQRNSSEVRKSLEPVKAPKKREHDPDR